MICFGCFQEDGAGDVDTLDAFMATEILPEVKAKEAEERKKLEEERLERLKQHAVRRLCGSSVVKNRDDRVRACLTDKPDGMLLGWHPSCRTLHLLFVLMLWTIYGFSSH